jgi:hypothetical protein
MARTTTEVVTTTTTTFPRHRMVRSEK